MQKRPSIPAARPVVSRGTSAHARKVADATARFSARRQRDALPLRIETRRLMLRAPMRGDVPDLVRLADNPRIAAVLSRLPSPYTRADGIGFVEIIALREDGRPYAITLDDRLIGVVGFTYHTDGEPPELGYWLGEPFWGKGYMTEAVRALLESAFATRLFPRVRARALKSNTGSQNVLRKAGFVLTREEVADPDTPHAGQPMVFLMAEQPRWT